MRIIWQTVRRITCEILGVKGLTNRFHAVMCLFGNKSQMMSNVVSVGKKCMQGTAECFTGVLITFSCLL